MVDMNKQALDIWNAIKPMIDKEIENKTRGMVQRRKAKVTTAPNGSVIGVTEAFGPEISIPYISSMSSAQVGDVVWVEFMYGATNAFASMYASADTKDWTVGGDANIIGNATINGVLDVTNRRCSATLSSAGWYRLMKYEAANASDVVGLTAFVVDFSLLRRYANNPNEAHKISLFANYNSFEFLNEVSKSLSVGIDKIRYTYNGTNGYVDIHYSLSASNFVSCDFTVHAPMYQRRFTVESLQSVADAPAGETVLITYTFFAKTDDETSLTGLGKTWYFKKKNGVVFLEGAGDVSSASSGFNVIGNLPAGFRPQRTVRLMCQNYVGGLCFVYVYIDGTFGFYNHAAISSARNGDFTGSWIAYS